MVKLGLDWSAKENTEEPEGKSLKTDTGQERFEFVFLIQLKDVDTSRTNRPSFCKIHYVSLDLNGRRDFKVL